METARGLHPSVPGEPFALFRNRRHAMTPLRFLFPALLAAVTCAPVLAQEVRPRFPDRWRDEPRDPRYLPRDVPRQYPPEVRPVYPPEERRDSRYDGRNVWVPAVTCSAASRATSGCRPPAPARPTTTSRCNGRRSLSICSTRNGVSGADWRTASTMTAPTAVRNGLRVSTGAGVDRALVRNRYGPTRQVGPSSFQPLALPDG